MLVPTLTPLLFLLPSHTCTRTLLVRCRLCGGAKHQNCKVSPAKHWAAAGEHVVAPAIHPMYGDNGRHTARGKAWGSTPTGDSWGEESITGEKKRYKCMQTQAKIALVSQDGHSQASSPRGRSIVRNSPHEYCHTTRWSCRDGT